MTWHLDWVKADDGTDVQEALYDINSYINFNKSQRRMFQVLVEEGRESPSEIINAVENHQVARRIVPFEESGYDEDDVMYMVETEESYVYRLHVSRFKLR